MSENSEADMENETSDPDGPEEQPETPGEDAAADATDDLAEDVGAGGEDPDTLRARLAEIETALDASQEKQEETKQLWLRSRADYDNLKRRTEREREDIRKTATARLIGELLPQIEILQRAARELAEVDEAHAKGIQMALAGVQSALHREGLEEVPGEGHPFDPNLHEAVAREETDAPAGTITQVVRPGYTLHERLLQAALVKVSAGPGDEEARDEGPDTNE